MSRPSRATRNLRGLSRACCAVRCQIGPGCALFLLARFCISIPGRRSLHFLPSVISNMQWMCKRKWKMCKECWEGAEERTHPLLRPFAATASGFCQGFLIILLILNIDSEELAHLHLHRSPDLGWQRKLSLTFDFNIV